MSCLIGENIILCGNFAKLSEKRTKNFDKEYKCRIPYPFKWRQKIGKVECNCTVIEEHYQPYYGFTWYHNKGCAILKHIEKHPGILNLYQFAARDFNIIAQSE